MIWNHLSVPFLIGFLVSLALLPSSAQQAKPQDWLGADLMTAPELEAALIESSWDYTFQLYMEEKFKGVTFLEGGIFPEKELQTHAYQQWRVGSTLDDQVFLELVSEDFEMIDNSVVLRFWLEKVELNEKEKTLLTFQFDAQHWLDTNEPVDHAREQMQNKALEVLDGIVPAILTLED